MSIYGENTNYPTSQADLDINTAINYEFTDSLSHINKYFSPFDGAELDGISYALWMLPLSFELLEAWDHWEGLNHWNDQNIHDRFSKIGDWLAYEVMPDPQTQPCMFNTLNET